MRQKTNHGRARAAARLAAPMLAVAAILAAQGAAAGGPTTVLATADAAGNGAGGFMAVMTPDARFVAFSSRTRLVQGDQDDQYDVYVRDRRTNALVRASVPLDAAAKGDSFFPSISDDGRYVAFESAASNLVAGDVNGGKDVFVRDLSAASTSLVSVRVDGSRAGTGSAHATISGDGSTVAWIAPDLAITGTGSADLHAFVRVLSGSAAGRVDVGTTGGPPSKPVIDAYSDRPLAITRDGKQVAFASPSPDLVPGDTNTFSDVFVRDGAAGTTARVSVPTGLPEATGGGSRSPAMSADGSIVAFDSDAVNLVTGDTNTVTDIVVRDRTNGQTTRVSVTAGGGQLAKYSASPVISADGRHIAYQTSAAVVPTDANNDLDAYVTDRQTGTVVLASVGPAGEPAVFSMAQAVGRTGRYTMFSTSNSLVPADSNGSGDSYLRDSGQNTAPVAMLRPSIGPVGSLALTVDGGASSDADGWVVGYAWSFGDGGTATGPIGPHTYAAAGRYTVVLTVTDNDGATTTTSAAVEIPAAPTPPPATTTTTTTTTPTPTTTTTPAAPVRPRVTGASLTPARFSVVAAGGKIGRGHGAQLVVKTTEAGTVQLRFDRLLAGRRTAKACVPAAKRGARCTVVRTAATLSKAVRAGQSRIAITGRTGRSALPAGSYRLRIVLRTADARLSAPVTVALTVVAAAPKR